MLGDNLYNFILIYWILYYIWSLYILYFYSVMCELIDWFLRQVQSCNFIGQQYNVMHYVPSDLVGINCALCLGNVIIHKNAKILARST